MESSLKIEEHVGVRALRDRWRYREKLADMAAEAERADVNATFAPALNPRSLKMAERLRQEEPSPHPTRRPSSAPPGGAPSRGFPVHFRLYIQDREL